MIGYLDKALRPLVLIMPNMSGYIETFKVDDKKLLERYKIHWTTIEDLKKYWTIHFTSLWW